MIEGRQILPDRIGCCIDGCGRTFKRTGEASVVICGKHWRMAPKAARVRYTKLWRLYRRRGTPALAVMIDRQWDANLVAVHDVLAGNINPAELDEFLKTV